MITVTRGNPPIELVHNIQALRPEQRAYDALSTETKNALKESLLGSQGHLCAYCMSRIADVSSAKLEHIYPQSRSLREGHPGQTIDYGNMLAVCDGGSSRPFSQQTCDTHKGNELISIDPTSQDDIDTIHYLRNGEIRSTNPAFDHDLRETLNLNCAESYLPQNREGVFRELRKMIERENPRSHEEKRAFARRKLRSLEASAVKEPYVGVALYQLRRWAR